MVPEFRGTGCGKTPKLALLAPVSENTMEIHSAEKCHRWLPCTALGTSRK
jgi:hypothetical protein